MKRRAFCILLAVVLLMSIFPINIFAAHDSTGKPLDRTGDVYLALYIGGSDFPGEPAEHAVSGYLNLNASFGSTGFGKFAESAEDILEPSILDDVVQGTSGVWGVFSTTGGSRYLLPSSGLVDGEAGDTNKPHNAETEKKIIQTAINKGNFRLGNGESIDDYTIVWYVIKYQRSDSAWHIDGLITKKSTYSVNYYGNGNTSGGAPTGESGLQSGDVHMVLGNTGGLRKIVGNDTYIFNGWNTSADGTGDHYDAGDEIPIVDSNVTLYAEWYLQNKYTATVVTKLNDTETNVEDILGAGSTLYIELQTKEGGTGEYIPLKKGTAGTYTATVTENGAYHIWLENADGDMQKIAGYQVTIYNQNGRAELQYYSVSYDTNAGTDTVTWEGQPAPETTNYPITTPIIDNSGTPVRNGYTFLYWLDQDNNRIDPGQTITSSLTEKTVLTAQWQENIDVTVEVVIDHNGGDGFNNADSRHEALLQFLREQNGVNLPLDQLRLDEKHENYRYDEVNHITTYTLTFQNVPQAIYKVSAQKPLYDVTVTHTGQANQDQHIRVACKYAPENFDLTFNVVAKWDNEEEKELLPVAVNVKVLYWGYNNAEELGWHTITQQAGNGAPTTVYIDQQTGTGTGFYPVWKYWDNETIQGNYAYEYRIEVTSFVMPDGRVVPATGDLKTYTPNGSGLYTAIISVEGDGRSPTKPGASNLEGAYYSGTAQNGIPTATISIQPYTVTFDAGFGKLENKQWLLLENQYRYPDLNRYIPVPNNSNYTFIGWYDIHGNPAQNLAGTYLTEHVEYYAMYTLPMDVKGTVTVAGTYQQNGETVNIKEVDRANHVMVVLQKEINGQYMDVASYEAIITYEYLGADGSGDYLFTNLVQDGSEYRIVVLGRNYEATFDNESDAGIHYTPEEYTAVLGGDYIATVHAYLTHAPESYDQKMEVDASQISEAFRPTGALAEILYRDLGDIHPYGVISQHTVAPYGKNIALSAEGFGNSSESVWQYHTDGTLYEYQMNVTKLFGNVNGVFAPEGTVYNSDTAPFMIEYDPASRYSAAGGGQARTLKATLIPKEYEIIFDMGLDENETVLGMDSYLTDGMDGADYYSYLHTWSYEDSITAFPYRKGYVFVGWDSPHDGVVVGNDGGSITVAEGLAEDVTLKAIWRKLEGTAYTVRHLELNTEKPLQGAEVGDNVAIGFQLKATEWVRDIQGYSYAGAKIGDKMYSLTEDAVLTVTDDPTQNVLTLYYVKDGYTDQVESNLKLDKSVILTNNGTYTVNLETYTMDNPVTTMILQNTPLDIVLVLDQSGSVVQNGYLDDLQAAVDNFVEAVANHGRHNEVDHRIAIVGYASNATAGYTNSDTKNYPLAGGTLNEWVNTGVFDSNGDFHPYPVTGFNYTKYTDTIKADGTYYALSHDAYQLLDYHSTYHHLITEAEAREAVLNGTTVYGYIYDKNDVGSFVELTRNASGLWLYGDKQLYSAKEFFTYHTDVWTHRHGLDRREIHAYGTGSNFRCVDNHQDVYTRTETRNDNPELNIYQDALMPVSFGVNGSGRTNPNLIKATQSLGSNGGTYVQYGIEMANKIFAANPAGDRVRIMVTFTDGQPGNSGFDKSVANEAISLAYETKDKDHYGAYVYTIGLYPSSGVDSTSDVAVYMNAMSSNYPNAKDMDDVMVTGGYVTPSNGSKLNDGGSYYIKHGNTYYPIKWDNVYTTTNRWYKQNCWHYTRSGDNIRISTTFDATITNGRVGSYNVYLYRPGGYVETPYFGYYSTTESEHDLKEYFANVMTEITTNITTEIVLHGDTILRDIMGQGLVLTPNTVITAYRVGGHYNAATGQIEWSATKEKLAELSLKGQTASTLYSQATTDITFTNEDGTVTTRENVPYISVFNYSQNVNKTDADKPHTVDITGYDFENNYIKDGHDGYKMVIEITSVEARDDVQWGRSTATNHERSGLWLPADESGNRQLLMAFNQPTTIFVERAYVLDYGKEFVLSDWYFDDEEGKDATPVHLDFDITDGMNGFDVTAPNFKNAKDSAYGNPQYGNVRIENGKVIYSPTSMNWGGYDQFYVFGNTWRKTVLAQDANENGNLWNKVTVIPANNIYYEDSFITTDSTTQNSIEGFTFTGAWSVVGEDSGNTEIPEHLESAPYGDVHGWTDSLGDDVTFTDGSAHFTNTPGASAEFTFTGTGVEVYTFTNEASGMVVAVLNSKTVGEDGKEVITLYKSLAMDNLAVSGDYYHIPTVAFKNLPYGTYSLQLIATVANGEDSGMRSEYYIDGIRIHNPLGNTTNYYSSTVKDAYGLENNAVFTEVRDILIDKNNSFNADQPNIGGAVFIDQIKPGQGSGNDQVGEGVPTYEIGTFEAYGPKNEVYLSAGQAIVLKVEEGNTYYMGLKSLKGGTVTANVSGIDQNLRPTAITITHTTDMYYRINPVDGYIVIQNGNTDGAILSVTNLRTTNMREPVANGGVVPVVPQMAVMMMRSFSARLLDQENNPNPDESTEEATKSPVQIHTEETIAFASTLFLSVRRWLNTN